MAAGTPVVSLSMSQHIRSLVTSAALLAVLSCSAVASAQTASPAQTTTTPPPAEATRPATTTFFGDTGLWYVPTAEVLPAGKWSVSGYRRGTNYISGYTNVADFATTFAFGIKNRAEIFGSFLLDTRVDRDTKPLFFSDVKIGGIVDRYPGVNKTWSGNNLGDLYVGAKVSLMSEADRHAVSTAVRLMFKVPTGKLENGAGTGKLDTIADFIVSKEISRVFELSGFAGYEMRGKPDGYDIPGGAFRWGVGAGSPTRFPIRVFGEINGTRPSSDLATITSAVLIGSDSSRPPSISSTENLTRLTFGVTYQAKNGFFAGAGLSRNLPSQERNLALSSEGSFTDYTDWQFRIGYHPGVRKYVAPVPPPPAPMAVVAPAPPPPPAPRHTMSVKAACDVCSVEVTKIATVTATLTDSINCAATYVWTAPSGAFTSATARVTPWTASSVAGPVAVTVTATCPTDGMTASDTVTITVTKAVVKTYAFDDVFRQLPELLGLITSRFGGDAVLFSRHGFERSRRGSRRVCWIAQFLASGPAILQSACQHTRPNPTKRRRSTRRRFWSRRASRGRP